jgi:hypothetical protein
MNKPLKQYDSQLRDILKNKLYDLEKQVRTSDAAYLVGKLWIEPRKEFFDTIHNVLTYELWSDQ